MSTLTFVIIKVDKKAKYLNYCIVYSSTSCFLCNIISILLILSSFLDIKKMEKIKGKRQIFPQDLISLFLFISSLATSISENINLNCCYSWKYHGASSVWWSLYIRLVKSFLSLWDHDGLTQFITGDEKLKQFGWHKMEDFIWAEISIEWIQWVNFLLSWSYGPPRKITVIIYWSPYSVSIPENLEHDRVNQRCPTELRSGLWGLFS